MNASLWTPYISDGTVKAICWTLIHSLWIGMIIALLAGIIISLTRKSPAALRYRLLCAVLVSFIISIGITYYIEARSNTTAPVGAGAARVFINMTGASPSLRIAARQNQSIIDRAREFLNQNMNIIFLAWALFFVLKSLKMVSGLLYIQRIRNYKVHEVAEEFKHKIELLSSQIGIRQTVRLVQSELVKVPVAIGWLKPVILLPMGVILQLSTEQLESILWHELAHICRRDYLVNILQGLVEAVFFFNPGLLWLSSLIRAEREACCDDMVLSRMNRKANYLEALLSFGYENNSRTALAMSIGSGNQLRDRLKRMISQENKRLNMAEKIVLSAGLILLLAFTTLPKTTQAVRYLSHLMTKKPVAAAISKPFTVKPAVNAQPLSYKPLLFVKDTIVKKPDTAIHFTRVLSVLFNKKGDIDMGSNDILAVDNKGSLYHFIIAKNKLVAMYINDVQVSDSELAGYEHMIGYIDQAIPKKSRLGKEKIAYTNADSPTDKFRDQDQGEFSRQKYVDGHEARDMNLKLEKLKFEASKGRFRDDSTSYAAQVQKAHDVIADLVKEKVVLDAATVKWFGLSDTEMIVNGKKQPDDLHDKLMRKYGIHKDYGLFYGPVEMHGTGVFIDGPGGPAKPGSKFKGAIKPKFTDSVEWKNLQLIKQQQAFAAKQNTKRQDLIHQQKAFVANQDVQRRHIAAEQQRLVAEQARMLQRLKAKQDGAVESKIAMPDILANIADELVSDNIVKDKNDLRWFSLTNASLIVNGKVQPEEAHQKLKDKYLKPGQYPSDKQISQDPDFGWHYNLKNGNMGFGIMKMSGFQDN